MASWPVSSSLFFFHFFPSCLPSSFPLLLPPSFFLSSLFSSFFSFLTFLSYFTNFKTFRYYFWHLQSWVQRRMIRRKEQVLLCFLLYKLGSYVWPTARPWFFVLWSTLWVLSRLLTGTSCSTIPWLWVFQIYWMEFFQIFKVCYCIGHLWEPSTLTYRGLIKV